MSKQPMLRVLITGAAGRIGRELVDELTGSYDLHLIDRRPASGRTATVADLGKIMTEPASARNTE